MTSATFRKSGNIPLSKDMLIISVNVPESLVLNHFNVFSGTLLMSIALFGLMQLIRDSMTTGAVGGKKDRFISSLSNIM